jgi:hypothetical protein
MSRRNNRNRNWQSGQTIAPGYYNPEAFSASQNLTMASLDSICENINQVKQMVENDQPEQAEQFFTSVILTGVASTGRDLRKTVFLHRQKVRSEQSVQTGQAGESSPGISPSRLPNDPRQLNQLLEAVKTKLGRGQGASAS